MPEQATDIVGTRDIEVTSATAHFETVGVCGKPTVDKYAILYRHSIYNSSR